MKIIVLFLLALFVVEAVSATQRMSAIRPGNACAGIMEIEKNLGSHELADTGPAGVSKYAGKEDGKDATIIYKCEKGILTEQKVVVTASSRDQAYDFANAQKSQLTSRLGEPLHDGLELGIWSRLFLGFKGADRSIRTHYNAR